MNIYQNINKLYNKELLSIQDACTKIGISKSTYYAICKTLNKKSAPEKQKIKDEKKKNKKIYQKGGDVTSQIDIGPELPNISKNILSTNNINTNYEQNNDIEQDLFRTIRDELGKTNQAINNTKKCKDAKGFKGRQNHI